MKRTIGAKVISAAKIARFMSDRAAYQRAQFPVIRPGAPLDPKTAAHNKDFNKGLYQNVVQLHLKVSMSDSKVKQLDRASRKLTVKERVALLKDEGAEVLELSQLAGLGMAYGDIFNASCSTAITRVSGQLCLISAHDWTIKGGTIYPITLKKQLRAQEIAMQNRLPCIYLVDSGGAFLPLQADIFPDKEHGGRVFRNQAMMSSLGIPQVRSMESFSCVCRPVPKQPSIEGLAWYATMLGGGRSYNRDGGLGTRDCFEESVVVYVVKLSRNASLVM